MRERAAGFSLIILAIAAVIAGLYEPRVKVSPPPPIPPPIVQSSPLEIKKTPEPQPLPPIAAVSSNIHPQSPPPAIVFSETHAESPSIAKTTVETPPSRLPPGIPEESVEGPPLPPTGAEPQLQIVKSGPSTSKQIAITFDDGPHPSITPKILEILKQHNIKATFFVLGNRVKQYPHILRQIVAEGHEIGNHTYSHRLLSAMTNELIEREITETQNEIRKAIGYETRLFRPPYGAFRPETKSIFHGHNLSVVLWSVDPQDWSIRDREKICQSITNATRNGSIVLCHDIHKSTLQALPDVLDGLKAKGFELTTVSHLCGLPTMKLVTADEETGVGSQNPISP